VLKTKKIHSRDLFSGMVRVLMEEFIMPDDEKKDLNQMTEAEISGRSILFSAIKTIQSIPLIIELLTVLFNILIKLLKKEKSK
jgi:hypothetical protein